MTDTTATAAPATTAAPVTSAPAAAAPAPAAAAAAPAVPATGSLLAAGSTLNVAERIPEKFQVKKADGSLDLDASWLKVAEHRDQLEKRLGSGDIRPKTADEYKFEPPADLAGTLNLASDPLFADFRTKAHEAGLSQKQFEFVMGEYLSRAPQLVAGAAAADAESATAALKAEWKQPGEFERNVGAAARAAQHFGGARSEALFQKFGNDPDFIAFAAAIGREMGEDSTVTGQPLTEADFETQAADLRKQLAEMPLQDKRRPAVRKQLDDLYGKRYNTGSRRLTSAA